MSAGTSKIKPASAKFIEQEGSFTAPAKHCNGLVGVIVLEGTSRVTTPGVICSKFSVAVPLLIVTVFVGQPVAGDKVMVILFVNRELQSATEQALMVTEAGVQVSEFAL